MAQKATLPSSDDEVTIFDRICSGEIPANIVYQDEKCLAFTDVAPMAKVHLLVIPKTSYKKGLSQLCMATSDHKDILGHLMVVVSKLVSDESLGLQNGYRVVINDGKHGCQSVYHLHLHIIGGQQLSWPPGV